MLKSSGKTLTSPPVRSRGNAAGTGDSAAEGQGGTTAGYGANPYDTYTWELHTDPSMANAS